MTAPRRTFDISMSLIRDSNGAPHGFRGVAQDVTDRLKADEERAELEEKLRRSEKLEAIGTLAGGVAHDFNNLLTGILGYAQMLKQDSRPRRFRLRCRSRHRGSRYPCLPADRPAPRLRPPGQAPEDFGRSAPEHSGCHPPARRTIDKNIRIESMLPSEAPCTVLGDPAQLQQVVLNLAINARDAMPSGGKLLTFEARRFDLASDSASGPPTSWSPGPYVELVVRDTGVGMTPEVRERIFEPFFTTKEPGQGTGMGLAMVYGPSANHGGDVRFDSRPGEGSVFHVCFPYHGGELGGCGPLASPFSSTPARVAYPGHRRRSRCPQNGRPDAGFARLRCRDRRRRRRGRRNRYRRESSRIRSRHRRHDHAPHGRRRVLRSP
jgi:two-component system, cell cycle sensor histidine kinase and response regulator CckA